MILPFARGDPRRGRMRASDLSYRQYDLKLVEGDCGE
jgi:hypothetical protein